MYFYISGEAKFRGDNIGDPYSIVVPQHEYAASGACCRSLDKAAQAMTPQEGCKELINQVKLSLLKAYNMT